jgi:hypothetical protein
MHLRELWRLRLAVVVAALAAAVGALWSLNEISLFPPKLTPRSVETAAASTRVLVDSPRSMVLDLRQGTYDFDTMRNRAILIGNVMASSTVREYIAREVGVPADALQVTPPRTPEAPRPRAEVGQEKRATDILKSNDEYRLDIQANATVPILDVYSQAPTARSAEALTNAAVAGTRQYLGQAALTERTGRGQRVEMRQLGAAHGRVLNGGVSVQVGLLAFILFFAVACTAVMAVARIWRGWRVAASQPAAMS